MDLERSLDLLGRHLLTPAIFTVHTDALTRFIRNVALHPLQSGASRFILAGGAHLNFPG